MSGRLSTWDAEDLAQRLSKPGRGRSKRTGDGWKACCPAHDDRTPSLSLSNGEDGKLLYYCFGGCQQDDVRRALLAVIGGEEAPQSGDGGAPREREKVEDPRKVVFPVPDGVHVDKDDFLHQTYGRPSKVWTYRLPEGRIGGWVARFDLADGGKEVIPFTWTRHDGTGVEELRMKSMPAPRPLYNLDRIVANPDATILLVEGEKAADAAPALFPDWIPTALPGGGNAVRLADLAVLANRTVVVWPDHDGPGYEFMLKIIQHAPNSCDLRMLVFPEAWPTSKDGSPYVRDKGDDAYDAAEDGWTTELLREAKDQGHVLVHRIKILPEKAFEEIHYTERRPPR